MRRLVTVLSTLAAALAVLAFPAAFLLDALAGRDVYLVERGTDPAVLALQKEQWKEDHADGKGGAPADVARIYGSPLSAERVLFASKDDLLVPDEDRSLTLLLVTKAGQNPLQRRTVFFFAKWTAIVGGASALVGLALLATVLKRRPAA